jgi:hypothetical protein
MAGKKPRKSVEGAAKADAKQAEAEAAVLGKIAAWPGPFRTIGERLHRIILSSSPELKPRTWYGMPGYEKDGKTVCFFRADSNYMTFGFTQDAGLKCDLGAPDKLIVSAWFLTEMDEATETKASELVRTVAGMNADAAHRSQSRSH